MSLMILSLLLALLIILLCSCCWWSSSRSARLPPGPRPLPLIGHLHLLARGPAPNILFSSLARKYGPIISLRFGSVPVVVASSIEAAREFLKTHDAVFASRPPTAVGRIVFDNYRDIVLAPNGERWRQLRRICTMELFTPRMIQSFKNIRMEEVRSLLEYLASSSAATRVDVRFGLTALAFNHISKVLMGKRYCGANVDDKSEAALFIQVIHELTKAAGQFPVGDFLHWLRWMDIGKVEARFKSVCTATDALIGKIIREHKHELENSKAENRQEQVEDFIHVLLKVRDQGGEVLQGSTIKVLLLDLFVAGSDTLSIMLEWALAELIKHPCSMAKLQEEISQVTGPSRLVEESDVGKLEYLQAVVKETFRLHPAGPMLFPHFSADYSNVMGYDIPKGTMLFVNIYGIGRDPALWKEPLEFKPERFLDSPVSFSGQHFELLPFGAGRRMCPGMSMAVALLHLALANLVHAFDWKVPPGEQVDTQTETYGATVLMANKLQAIPVPRLSKEVFVA